MRKMIWQGEYNRTTRRRKYKLVKVDGVLETVTKARSVSPNRFMLITDSSFLNCSRRFKDAFEKGEEMDLWRIVSGLGVQCVMDESVWLTNLVGWSRGMPK